MYLKHALPSVGAREWNVYSLFESSEMTISAFKNTFLERSSPSLDGRI
jgi:hypothetical protein